MGSKNRYEGIDEYAIKFIKHKARTLVGTAGFTIDDLEDIEQELMIDLLKRMKKYDASKAQFNTFTDRIVNHKIANMVRSKNAAKRDFRMTATTETKTMEGRDGFWQFLMDTISTDTYYDRMGYQSRCSDELHDLQIDLDRLFARLTEDERRLLELLKRMTLTEAARELGIPRMTLVYRLSKLRKWFIDNGLRDYLRD